MISSTIRDVTHPDPGDYFPEGLPVEAIRAYSIGRLPPEVERVRGIKRVDDGLRVHVIRVKVDGVWVPL